MMTGWGAEMREAAAPKSFKPHRQPEKDKAYKGPSMVVRAQGHSRPQEACGAQRDHRLGEQTQGPEKGQEKNREKMGPLKMRTLASKLL